MRQRVSVVLSACTSVVVTLLLVNSFAPLQGQTRQESGMAAVSGQKGGQDVFGGYDVVPNWPKPISSLPGNEKWTWGAGQGVFADGPNRVFILQGELPKLERPRTTAAAARPASSSQLPLPGGATAALPGAHRTMKPAAIR